MTFSAKSFDDRVTRVKGQPEEQARAASYEDAAARFFAVGTAIFSNRL